MLSVKQSVILFTTSLLAATLGSSIARAGTSCKGLDLDQCASQAACLWVKGYARKDGREVKGYCRGKGSGTKAMTDKGASAGKADPLSSDARSTDKGAS